MVERDDDGNVVLGADESPIQVDDNAQGELALAHRLAVDVPRLSPRTRAIPKCFAGEWYLTGDSCRRDDDGWFWFVGRGDDVIKTAGHLVGPFEVESALMEHPAVAEAGVIGVPDPVAGAADQGIRAPDPTASNRAPPSSASCSASARKRLGAAVAPKEIEFALDLPHTRSGKIMRRLLRARELGLSEGDLSTLEHTP